MHADPVPVSEQWASFATTAVGLSKFGKGVLFSSSSHRSLLWDSPKYNTWGIKKGAFFFLRFFFPAEVKVVHKLISFSVFQSLPLSSSSISFPPWLAGIAFFVLSLLLLLQLQPANVAVAPRRRPPGVRLGHHLRYTQEGLLAGAALQAVGGGNNLGGSCNTDRASEPCSKPTQGPTCHASREVSERGHDK